MALFKAFAEHVGKAPLASLKDYLRSHIVNNACGALSDDFYAANFDFFSRQMAGIQEHKPRWKRAMAVPNGVLGEAVGKMYVERYFPEAYKKQMLQLVKNLQVALGQHIDALDWMGDSTKVRAHEKLDNFTVKIGYPDKWKDYSSLKVDPKKVIAVVETNLPDGIAAFTAPDAVTTKIGENVAEFLIDEYRKGIIPKEFLPLQSGVGNVANAVLGSLGNCEDVPPFTMFTEVVQNSVIGLMKRGRITYASGSSLTLSDDVLQEVYKDYDFFKSRLLLRPQEVTNHPELTRRLGVIAINTALEADIFGNVNSTNVSGSKMMNGIGGSADFARNAFLSIFTCPSVAKGGVISAIVPMASHIDSSENSVKVIVTEQGVADLRGKSPLEKAQTIIENCVHPDYKELLWDYLKMNAGHAHTPASLINALKMHITFAETGDMRNTKWN